MNRGRQGIIEASLSRSFFYSRRAILADNGANTLVDNQNDLPHGEAAEDPLTSMLMELDSLFLAGTWSRFFGTSFYWSG